jgi:hypothetical protein
MADVIFNADGSAKDISLSSQFCVVNRFKGTNPLDVTFNNEYQRYMACFNPVNATGASDNITQSSFYQVYYSDNPLFMEKLSNTHSLEVVAMADDNYPLSNNNEVKIFSSQGGGGTGIQIGTRNDFNNEFVFQIRVGGDWRRVRSGVVPVRGRYYHVVGVWNKAESKVCIYVDGERKGEMTQSGDFGWPTNANTYWFAIGGTSQVSGTVPRMDNVFRGNIVVARIHSKPLTDEDVATLYRQLK